MEALFIVFMVFLIVWIGCLMTPLDPKKIHTGKRIRNAVTSAVNWKECDKCNKLFLEKRMHKMDDGKYLCKMCHGLVKIYMDS